MNTRWWGLLFLFPVVSAYGKDLPVEARLIGGGVSVSPQNVNDELKANGLKKISATLLMGIEADFRPTSVLTLGLRYAKNQVNRDEDPSDELHNYKVFITQDLIMGMARVSLLNSKFARLEVFGGAGGATTTLKLETSTQAGEITRNTASDLFSTPVSTYGGTLALGYKNFFLFAEAGALTAKIRGFQRSGTVNSNIQTIDLSGPYAMLGVILGAPSFTKASSK